MTNPPHPAAAEPFVRGPSAPLVAARRRPQALASCGFRVEELPGYAMAMLPSLPPVYLATRAGL